MDPRKLIQDVAQEGNYFICEHAFHEADNDGVNPCDIENVMIRGIMNQKKTKDNRYRLRHRDIQVVIEIFRSEVTIVTVMRDR